MTKTPLDKDVTCIYCGINKAVWKCELEAGEVRLTAPLCNVCSNLPDTILLGQLIGKKAEFKYSGNPKNNPRRKVDVFYAPVL